MPGARGTADVTIPARASLMRLIDLHVDWLLQYARESVVFDPALYPGIEARLGQAEGYLQATRAAILSCYRRTEDWERKADPWLALGELITRSEAEFSGRLLIGPEDFDRWQEERDTLSWGMIGVEGFDALVRSTDDLTRLAGLFERGVRLFQPIYNASSLLGGSSVSGDDRGLTELGLAFLETVLEMAPDGVGPRPILDLAHLNQRTTADVLGWCESDPSRSRRLILAYSHGAPVHAGYRAPRALSIDNLTRLRAMGGFVGLGISPPFFEGPEQFLQAVAVVAEIPFERRVGHEGIAIGTDFLGVDRTLAGLGNAGQVVAWMLENFDRTIAKDLLQDNALALLGRSTGFERHR